MNDNDLSLASRTEFMPPRSPAVPAGELGPNFRELFDIVWSGKWVVILIAASCTALGVVYALTAQPVYQASGLVQVEQAKDASTASLDQLSALIRGKPVEAPAEVSILTSHMVLDAVASSLRLQIKAEPDYFPVIGRALASRRALLARPAAAPLGLNGFAWGGEKIRVMSLDVPASWQNRPLLLEASTDGYVLRSPAGGTALSGRAGERASGDSADGPISIFVQELSARPGTRFILHRLAKETAFSMLFGSLTVAEQPRESGMLSIQFGADTPEFAAQVVNGIEEVYLRQNVERLSAQAEQSLKFLKEQLPTLKAKVDEAEAQLNQYQLQKGTVDVLRETDLVLTQSVTLETERLRLSQEREAAAQRFTSQNPVIVTLGEQIRSIEREQAKLKKQVESLPETQQEILSLMRDLEVNTQLYTALLNSAQELQVVRAGTVGNVRIIDRASPPLAPIKPNKKIIVLLSAFIGAILGIVTVFLIRALLRGVDRPEDVERVTGLPTYASIPYSRAEKRIAMRMKAYQPGNHLLASVNGEDLAVEALRSLRTSLHFAMLDARNNVLMITGPAASQGKTFLTINLGAVLAMAGKRVVVVDADLRHGHLHRFVGVNQMPGISDHIAGAATERDIIRHTHVDNLDFIAGGIRAPNPSEILMHERLAELLRRLSKLYDYVLIDTPPALLVTDAAIIGRLAGTTLLVLKSAEHPMRAIEETVKRLRNAGVYVRGFVFNQVGARVGSYGYGAYGYSYGYSNYAYRTTSK